MIIPVDMDDIPTTRQPLDESLTYRGICRRAELSRKTDKNGDYYAVVNLEVAEPVEWKGRFVTDNYLRLPVSIATLRERLGREPLEHEVRDAQERGTRFARFVKCLKVPYTKAGINITDAIGREGMFTISNEEFPEGSGDLRSRVRDYLYAG